ncbi:coiled-coil domain-containing protein 172 [Archocentrus centrarchus]|uniref:coiled-coil domain-containing protein 172 n=1 Tax=Archocentrus centrarchus TaxID=63155 RepID=UPI0011E9DFBB|nr:coiled-coil domain-containing protein 172 [Archocentrus centrarchus]
MSLDTLFHQILLTEQQLAEQTQKIKDVKVAIIRCNEKIKSATEKYEESKEELDVKAQRVSAVKLQHDLAKKYEDQMLKQIEELLRRKSHLREHLTKIKTVAKEEEKTFLQEISRFNSDFSLQGNRETVSKSQTHTVLLDLEKEVESIYKEMELMSCRNSYVCSTEEEKRVLLLELQSLDNIEKDLDRQLSEAEAMTESLRLESQFVSQKPHSDSSCLRLRRSLEVEMHREGELEHLREELSSEIQLLQSKLDSSPGPERH